MVQGYYTIDEAARILKMSPEKLSQMAQKREIRAFADRGTWRFRTQDVEEMARRQGQASDEVPNLANMASGGTPTSPKGKATHLAGTEPLGFELNPESADVVDVGKSPGTGSSVLSAVVPKPGSDSDVHIVSDSDQDMQLPGEGGKKAGAGKKGSPTPPTDSEPQIVPFDDSPDLGAQGPKSPSDSDVRLEKDPKTSSGELPATEEVHIDLDTDLIKAEEAARSSAMGKAKPKPRAKTPDPKVSPFELSDVDVNLPKSPSDSTRPTGDSDVVTLGELSPKGELAGSSASGINLHSPTDSGINLEKSKKGTDETSPSSSSEIEFELSLDSGSTPSPAADSDSSVNELDLESSSSEFELTLDDTGGLAPLDEKTSPAESGEKDIFETDLEVPALESDSASEVVPLDDADTDLESSDFDFDPSDSESGSQVVALDEEISDSAATVQRKSRPKKEAGEGEEEIDEVEALLTSAEASAVAPAEEEVEPGVRRVAGPAVAAAPANWGSLPAIIMIPCVIVMFLLTFMAFELLHDMWGYRSSSKASAVLLKPVCSMLGVDLPPD